jgi:hypothetical protein
LFATESSSRSRAWGIAKNIFDNTAKFGSRFTTFNGYQGIRGRLPTSPPKTNLDSVQTDFFRDRRIECTTERE